MHLRAAEISQLLLASELYAVPYLCVQWLKLWITYIKTIICEQKKKERQKILLISIDIVFDSLSQQNDFGLKVFVHFHPCFPSFLYHLAKCVKYSNVTGNGNEQHIEINNIFARRLGINSYRRKNEWTMG